MKETAAKNGAGGKEEYITLDSNNIFNSKADVGLTNKYIRNSKRILTAVQSKAKDVASKNKTDKNVKDYLKTPKKTDKSPKKTDKSPKKTDKLPKKTDKLPKKTDKPPKKTDKMNSVTKNLTKVQMLDLNRIKAQLKKELLVMKKDDLLNGEFDRELKKSQKEKKTYHLENHENH